MADELHLALIDAVDLAQEQPPQYFRLLTAGIRHISQNFSWNRAALEYVRHAVQ